jgi:hypothetical protein
MPIELQSDLRVSPFWQNVSRWLERLLSDLGIGELRVVIRPRTSADGMILPQLADDERRKKLDSAIHQYHVTGEQFDEGVVVVHVPDDEHAAWDGDDSGGNRAGVIAWGIAEEIEAFVSQ